MQKITAFTWDHVVITKIEIQQQHPKECTCSYGYKNRFTHEYNVQIKTRNAFIDVITLASQLYSSDISLQWNQNEIIFFALCVISTVIPMNSVS